MLSNTNRTRTLKKSANIMDRISVGPKLEVHPFSSGRWKRYTKLY